jgi:predicted RND superfamily exporter protein
MNWGARLFDDLPNQHPARTAMEQIDQQMAGTVGFDIEIHGPNSNFWKTPENLEKLNLALTEARALPHVGSILGLSDFVKVLSNQKSIPTDAGAVSEIFFLFSLNPNTPLKNYLSASESNVRVASLLRDVPANQSIETTDKIKSIFKRSFPDLKQRYGGVASYIHQLNNNLSFGLMRGFLEALAAIAIVLVFVFRSVRWALVACIPNLVPPAVLFGILWLTEVPIKPSLAIVFSISLGFAFNNTVYLLLRIQSLIKERKSLPEMEEILALEGPGCLFSTVVVLVGFLVFLGAQFSINIMFGTFMIIATLAALFSDLIFFPSLIKWCPGLLFSAPDKDPRERTRTK